MDDGIYDDPDYYQQSPLVGSSLWPYGKEGGSGAPPNPGCRNSSVVVSSKDNSCRILRIIDFKRKLILCKLRQDWSWPWGDKGIDE